MKISKIFHCLYFSLLVLPLLIFLPTGLYYAFNEHADNGTQTATATADVEYQYRYETNEVNSLSDLVAGNIYHANKLRFYTNSNDYEIMLHLYRYAAMSINDYDTFDFYDNGIVDDFDILSSFNSEYSVIYYYLSGDFLNGNFNITDGFDFYLTCPFERLQVIFYNVDFIIPYNVEEFISVFEENLLDDNTMVISSSTFNVIEDANAVITSIEYNNDNSIVNAMSSAWDYVWALPLFSWTSSSFILTPTSYLSGFFGIAANSSINLLLTYWLSISIVWLMFDVMMYVPLLIHHYLDKAEVS